MTAANSPTENDSTIARAYHDETSIAVGDAIRRYPQSIIWAVAMSFAIVMIGYDAILMTSLLAYPSFVDKFGTFDPDLGNKVISTSWQILLVVASACSGILGYFAHGYVVERFGHRIVAMAVVTSLAGLIFVPFFAPSIEVLVVSQVLFGIPWSVFAIMGTAYSSEICPTALRGYLTSLSSLCWVIGQFIVAGVLQGLIKDTSTWGFKIPFAIEWIFPIPVFVIALMAPDSPWWLIRRGRVEDAKRALRRLSNLNDDEIDSKVLMMRHTNRLEQKIQASVSIWDCFRGTNLRRTEIACLSISSPGLVGQALAHDPSYFFVEAGLSASDAYKMNFGGAAIAFVTTCLSWAVMSWVGNRRSILFGYCVLTLILFIIGILSYAPDANAAKWGQAGLVALWLAVYSATISPQSFVIASEVSATRLRSATMSLAGIAFNLVKIFDAVVEPYLINPTAANLKGKTAFVWFGISMLVTIWGVFRIPETRGRTFAELDVMFEKKVPAWRFASAEVDILAETDVQARVVGDEGARVGPLEPSDGSSSEGEKKRTSMM